MDSQPRWDSDRKGHYWPFVECAEKPNYLGNKEFFLLSHVEKQEAKGHIFRDTTIFAKLFFLYRKTGVSKHKQTHTFFSYFQQLDFYFISTRQ